MNVIPSVKRCSARFWWARWSYANFKHEQFSYLNIIRIDSKLVQKDIECGLACLQVTSCSSFNLATFPDINGKLLCELLPSDKHRMPNELIHNPMFDHFSKTVSVVWIEKRSSNITIIVNEDKPFQVFLGNSEIRARKLFWKDIISRDRQSHYRFYTLWFSG